MITEQPQPNPPRPVGDRLTQTEAEARFARAWRGARTWSPSPCRLSLTPAQQPTISLLCEDACRARLSRSRDLVPPAEPPATASTPHRHPAATLASHGGAEAPGSGLGSQSQQTPPRALSWPPSTCTCCRAAAPLAGTWTVIPPGTATVLSAPGSTSNHPGSSAPLLIPFDFTLFECRLGRGNTPREPRSSHSRPVGGAGLLVSEPSALGVGVQWQDPSAASRFISQPFPVLEVPTPPTVCREAADVVTCRNF